MNPHLLLRAHPGAGGWWLRTVRGGRGARSAPEGLVRSPFVPLRSGLGAPRRSKVRQEDWWGGGPPRLAQWMMVQRVVHQHGQSQVDR